MTPRMQVSVVIPCHNGVELTRRCIDSLAVQSGTSELEILIVDNDSADGTTGLGRHHPTVRVLRQSHNLGFAGGVNAGLRQAHHPLVVVLNNDTAAATNLLAELHAVLAADPGIGAVAPVSNHVKGAAQLAVGAIGQQAAGRGEVAAALRTAAPVQDVDSLAGLCLMMRRATFAEIGLFDERFGHGNFEDDDLCLRLRLHGYRLAIARRAFLHHEGHATFKALGLDLAGELARRRAQFVAKWHDDPAGRATIAALAGDRATAAAAAAQARIRWPRWPDADWHLGRWHATAGDPARAARHFAALLRACPAHSEAALELGLQHLAAGDERAARAVFAWTAAQCHTTAPHQVRMLRALGEAAHARRCWSDAARCFRDALELAPADGSLHNALGSALLAANDLRAAHAAFAAATAHGFPLAHTNLGICHQRAGDDERALHCFARAVELLPDDPIARGNHAAMTRAVLSRAIRPPRTPPVHLAPA